VSDQRYFLQDSRGLVGRNLMFWSAGGNGYTSDLSKAQQYSHAEAQRQHDIRESDIPWPVDYIQARFYTPVDMQQLRHVDTTALDVAFYRQITGHYSGNDIVWFAADGKYGTTDLRLARIYSSLLPGSTMWQAEEIKKIARSAVRADDVSLKEALAGTGIVLRKPRKQTNPRAFNCLRCGRFISELLRYHDCPHCGADNRP